MIGVVCANQSKRGILVFGRFAGLMEAVLSNRLMEERRVDKVTQSRVKSS